MILFSRQYWQQRISVCALEVASQLVEYRQVFHVKRFPQLSLAWLRSGGSASFVRLCHRSRAEESEEGKWFWRLPAARPLQPCPFQGRAGRSNFLDALAFFAHFWEEQGGQRPGRQQPPLLMHFFFEVKPLLMHHMEVCSFIPGRARMIQSLAQPAAYDHAAGHA